MRSNLSRRDFLKLAALSTAGLAFTRFPYGEANKTFDIQGGNLARIATRSVSVFSRPDDQSRILYQRYRDDLVNLYYPEVAETPKWNPLWYRVWGGYIHSMHLQYVDYRLNPVVENFPAEGQIGEITVPYTNSFRSLPKNQWQPVYRLYYGQIHWVMGVQVGMDGRPWYRLKDELLDVEYSVPAENVRLIGADELTPISPDVPPQKKRIEVSLLRQELTAYEYDKVVMKTEISSGIFDRKKPPESTMTPSGEYHVESKMPSKHMGDGNLTDNIEAYELPGVPWVSFFVMDLGVAFHGTLWHQNYGTPMSHGCINMKPEESKWIFNWTTPVYQVGKIETNGYGTLVTVT
ncbi:MAG: L,D-transpeptidase [Anaerolineaceae bacterium]|nr:L,D-transpeptidase [Anaerolineaceae bacterium]